MLRRSIGFFCLLVCLPLAVAAQAEDVVPPWPVEETAGSAITSIHGEVLGHFDEASKASGSTLNKEIIGKVDLYTKAIGRTAGVIDVAGKLYAGDTSEAALSAGLTVLGELAGTEGGKAILGLAGLTTAPVTTAIFAIQVGLASKKAVDDSTDALQLEILYASIERDPALKNRSRDLGVGDPIPVTPQSIEYAWRKVYIDSQWQAGFKVYVVDQLGKDWPEQSYWDQLMLPEGNSADQAALLDRSAEYKPYMASLLSQLNKLAQSREQFVVARRSLDQIKEALGQISSDKALSQYIAVLGQRAEVIKFIAEANGQLTKPQSSDVLLALATKAKYYAQSMELLPTEGKIGAERQQLLADLRRIYDTAWSLRNKQTSESVSEALTKMAASLPSAVPRPSRYEGVPAQEYMTVAKREFEQSKIRLNVSPAASALAGRERKAIREYYQRQIDQFVARKPTENEVDAFAKAARTLESVDLRQVDDAYGIAAEFITSLHAKHNQFESQVMNGISQLEAEVRKLKKRSDKIRDIVSGYCQGSGLTMPGYVGITSSFRIPPVDRLATDPSIVKDKLGNFFASQRAALSAYSVVSVCSEKWTMQGTTALSALPSAALSLLDAKEVESAVALLRVQVESVQARVEAIKWYDEKRMDAFRQEVNSLVTMVREANDGLQGADATRSKILAFIPELQTQLANIDNDYAYLLQLHHVSEFLPILYGARDLYGNDRAFTSAQGTRWFLLRPGVSIDCSVKGDLRPLMSASDFESMRREFDRRMSVARITWLSDSYNLGLTAYMKEQFEKPFARTIPAGDYVFLGDGNNCNYYEPVTFEQMATLVGTFREDMYFPRAFITSNSNDFFGAVLGLAFKGTEFDEKGFRGLEKLDLEKSKKGTEASTRTRALALDYWNAASRDALAKLVKAYDAAIARHADYLNKEADYAALLAEISPMYGAFTSSDFDARQLYDKNIEDPVALALYRRAEGQGKAALNAYRGASTNAKISPNRQAQLAKQADDIALQLHFVTSMIANMESQIRGRAEGTKAVARAEKITTFYSQFKAAYERKDASRLMAMLASDWRASDGTRPSDVETYFRNMFNVFDEIRFDIGEVQVDSMDGDRIQVSYSVSIKGIIFNIDTEHEEKSSVTEVVSSPDSGSVRILQTLQGRFWYP